MPSDLSGLRARRDSSLPTQMLLRPRAERDDDEIANLDLSNIDHDPITYFLTPAQYDDGNDEMDFEMDFDAGIEDAKHPPGIVRSVSPSSLGGFSLPPPRVPTPPRRSASPDTDRDMPPTPDDTEDYIHFAGKGRSHPFGLPFSLRDLTEGSKSKAQAKHGNGNTDALLSPTGSSALRSTNQTRTRSRPGPRPARPSQNTIRRSRSRSISSRRSHAWREPSPDVWSIEEETEEELTSDMGDSTFEGDMIEPREKGAIDIPAAKPKKKVRFVLPVRDDEASMH